MAKKIKSVIFAPVEPVFKDQYDNLPLHVPVVPPFTHNPNRTDVLRQQIRERLEQTHEMTIHGLGKEEFNRETTVRLIGGSSLYPLHDELFTLAKRFSRTIDDSCALDQYQPHVSVMNNGGDRRELQAGERRHIRSIVLAQKAIELEQAQWHIVDTFELKKWDYSYETTPR